MKTKVGIVDCAISNLTSVLNALRHIGADAEVIRDQDGFESCTHMVLPGVGSFATGMANLEMSGLVTPIREWARAGKPLIGMCLGMQLLAEEGEEFGPNKGLGLIPGRVARIKTADPALRLPHIGWNDVEKRGNSRLLREIDEPAIFYFVHGYSYDDPNASYVTGVCQYGGAQVAVIEQDNVFGTQFHPEKSQKYGLALLRNFIAITGT